MEVPGPPPANSIRSAHRLLQLLKQDVLGFLVDNFHEHGDIYRLEVLRQRQLLVRHPDHIREVLIDKADEFFKNKEYTDPRTGLAKFLGNGLLTSNGEFWRRQRRLISPALHARRIGSYLDVMVDSTQRMLASWQDGSVADVSGDMTVTTLEIVSKCLFRADVPDDVKTIAHAAQVLQGMVEALNSAQSLLPWWFPTPQRIRESFAIRALDRVAYRLIAERRAAEGAAVNDAGDLLSMLLAAEDEDGKRMTDRQARDELVTMFIGGHETTANTLNWTWILLAQNPAAEARLHEELDRVLGGRPPSLEDLKRLPYATMVIKESLRLYPPAYSFARVAIKDTTVGGFPLPAGTELSIVPYATHRDARWWERPEEFMPERFAPENEANLTKLAWLPFGGGARMCAGGAFAMMAAQVMLALIASRYSLKLGAEQEIRPYPQLTLQPKGKLKMTLRAR
jgi:cytochrome P450